jgi:hypothetical protein
MISSDIVMFQQVYHNRTTSQGHHLMSTEHVGHLHADENVVFSCRGLRFF